MTRRREASPGSPFDAWMALATVACVALVAVFGRGTVQRLPLGAGDFTVHVGSFALGGIGTATFGAILLHALLGVGRRA